MHSYTAGKETRDRVDYRHAKGLKERKGDERVVGDIQDGWCQDDDKHWHRTFKHRGRTGHEKKREEVDRDLITLAPHCTAPLASNVTVLLFSPFDSYRRRAAPTTTTPPPPPHIEPLLDGFCICVCCCRRHCYSPAAVMSLRHLSRQRLIRIDYCTVASSHRTDIKDNGTPMPLSSSFSFSCALCHSANTRTHSPNKTVKSS